MSGAAQATLLAESGRLHLHHGPIDIVARAWGSRDEVVAAYRQAVTRFATILDELVEELALLRRPVTETGDRRGSVQPPLGAVAQRMVAAVSAHRAVFITPMAAVAGAVADTVLAAMVDGRDLTKAYVNNGGDIAVHLGDGQRLTAAVIGDPAIAVAGAEVELAWHEPARGMATSGWRGRSLSMGIADAVTVLAATAAEADVAATLLANEVIARHPAVRRQPAHSVRDDTDLGDRLVTVAVSPLPAVVIDEALDRGAGRARAMIAGGHAIAAYFHLQGESRVVAPAPALA